MVRDYDGAIGNVLHTSVLANILKANHCAKPHEWRQKSVVRGKAILFVAGIDCRRFDLKMATSERRILWLGDKCQLQPFTWRRMASNIEGKSPAFKRTQEAINVYVWNVVKIVWFIKLIPENWQGPFESLQTNQERADIHRTMQNGSKNAPRWR